MMKTTTFLALTLFFAMVGCSEKKTSSSSSSQNALCTGTNYYSNPSCPGYGGSTTGTTAGYTTSGASGGSTGGTTGTNCAQNPFSYACYCQTNPLAYGCPTQAPQVSKNWGVKYPVTPSGSCSAPTNPGPGSYYPPRKGTVTINFKNWYDPASPVAPNYVNTTTSLKSVDNAKMFFLTDSLLKVRFKANLEPDAASTTPEESCFGRASTNSSLAGYTKLQFYAKIVGTKADGTVEEEILPGGPFTVQVNSCTPAIDLSSYASYYSGGMYLVIYNVRSNKGIWPSDYDKNGFLNSNSFTGDSSQRSVECWTMDIEVAADGTQTFN